ncbi:methyl-accepting chemotaxis protein [Halobium salinum]|uniref:Methyl-accepting chemotaxis protein n=1 Tax=Halobium salinum TaxID=1364940 RepID=A0ABD5PGU0_9EURY|nr:methyl-accepting chemotaxis protein [Halobium salinum]
MSRDWLNSVIPSRVRRNLAYKIFLGIFVVGLLVGTAGAYTYAETDSKLKQQVNEELTASAEAQANEVGVWVDQRRQTARMLSEYGVMKSNEPTQIRSFLVGEMGALPEDVTAVHYVDAGTNRIVTSTNEERVGNYAPNAAWAADKRSFDSANDVFRSDVFVDERTGASTISWASPVSGVENRLVVVSVDTGTISNHVGTTVAGGFVKVVDSGDGEVMMDSTDENSAGQYVLGADAPAVQMAGEGESGIMSMEPTEGLLDEPYLMAFAPVAGTDWGVVVHAPKGAAYALSSGVGANLLVLLAVAIGGLAVLGITFGRTTVRSIRDVEAKATELERGNLEVDVESDREDEIGALYRRFASMRDSLKRRIGEADEAAEEAERQREEVQEMAETLERRADQYGAVMQRCADGDLTERMDASTDNEAMRDIAEAFNGMMDDFEETMVTVRAFADEVAAESQEATASVEEVQNASGQVSESTQEIATGAERQSESLAETADEMSSLSASVEEVAAAANQVAGSAEAAADRGEDAQAHAEEAIAEMSEVESRTERTVAEVESLDEEMKQIGDIVEMITDIAEQTNLLALNASIEAARAGEAGEGFAVVADEIKQLAEEAGRATADIEELIDEIVASTEGAVDGMQATGESVTEGVDTVESALEALDDVVEGFEETNQGIQEINDATDDQASSTEEVVGMVEEVASVSEQTTAEASNVSAASEEQTASLNEVTTSVQSLSGRAERLQGLLDAFEVDDAGSRGTVADPDVGSERAADPDAGLESDSERVSTRSAVDGVINPTGPASTDGGFDFDGPTDGSGPDR